MPSAQPVPQPATEGPETPPPTARVAVSHGDSPDSFSSPVAVPTLPPAHAVPPPTEIATLPPLAVAATTAYPRSARTGEPRRPALLLAAIAAGWLSVAVTIGAFAQWWWRAAHVADFPTSARLLEWTQPDPVSALAIVLVITIAIIAVVMVAAAGTIAYNAWAGARWVRVGALVALGVTGLSYLLTWWFMAAMVPLAIAAILLFLPPVKRFLDAMATYHTPLPVMVPTSNIRYGPQPQIGPR